MSELATVGIDLAKSVFQIHGVDENGRVLVRSQLLAFFRKRPRCLIGMEACAGSHDWGRRLQEMGHDVRLMPPSYVKPYVKRGKTDAADAAAICEAVTRPSKRIEQLTDEIAETYEQSETSQRLATIPGVGMLSATIIAATTPDVGNFDCARDYAAWLGLTPKPHSTGGKQRVGRISKMGNRYIRRLLYLGAMAQIMLRCRLKREPGSDWLSSMLIRKKTKVAAIALAHRMARTIFALLRDGTRYQPQAAAA